MMLKITRKEWMAAWLEKKFGIISPTACANGYRYRYDLFKAMAERSRRMIKKYWRGYVCDPKWRRPEIWMDSIVFSTPQWNYVIQLPKFLIRIRSKQWARMKGADNE